MIIACTILILLTNYVIHSTMETENKNKYCIFISIITILTILIAIIGG